MQPPFGRPHKNWNWLRERFAIRMAAAIVSLLGNTDFSLTVERFTRLSSCRALIHNLFGAAPLNNADHVARKFLPRLGENGTVQLPFPDAIRRLSLLCNSESRLPLDYSACMRVARHEAGGFQQQADLADLSGAGSHVWAASTASWTGSGSFDAARYGPASPLAPRVHACSVFSLM